ncbi:threonine aldolase family protein [Anaeromusa acidaminophila]|uniref:threonine aldolase family protein n=1 Tax=Anaeromusa acidaminophila TaxID=81464 RepID=UPI00035D4AAA|nr:beta-eliminating lyase-related protein [Anaeromusa acidaminophila]
MYSFKNDYSEGAHPRLLAALGACNFEQAEGYGLDRYTQAAVKLLKQLVENETVQIHLLSGGTQTNLTALAAFLRPHEAAVAAQSGHILVHETGAIEATGHKVLSVPSIDGKVSPAAVEAMVLSHGDEHMVKPRLLYLSQPTEIGTLYSALELQELKNLCERLDLYLYVDGARLGSALCAPGNDVDLPELCRLADAFYIGGTKNGALLGEALVIVKEELKKDFRYQMKQKGALLAKGQVMGVQFQELFRDGLYFELARRANALAARLRQAIAEAGYSLLAPTVTNQVFPVLPNQLIAKLEEKFSFYVWEAVDESHSAIRLVTSWATEEAAVEAFAIALKGNAGR